MPANPALDSLRDDVRELLEFQGTGLDRIECNLATALDSLSKGHYGVAIHCLKSARTTRAALAEQLSRSGAKLSQEARR
ncbi:MAG TPA: hypothetical protein VK163_06105 [Opitutaceae bacterium]|nr:hypothetical protein [Opitutaceae bacterium]